MRLVNSEMSMGGFLGKKQETFRKKPFHLKNIYSFQKKPFSDKVTDKWNLAI